MAQISFTSRTDGSRFTGFFPPYATVAMVEFLLLSHALRTGATGELRARVEPATVADDREVMAFAVYAQDRPDSSLGVIPRDCDLIASAVSDVWTEVVQMHSRPQDDIADYEIVHTDAEPLDAQAPGIRVIGDRPSPWWHTMPAPPRRPIDLAEGVIIGSPTGQIARVFAASVLRHLLDFLTEDLENERMAALHGELAITPTERGLLPYVLYDAVSPLDGTATSHSVHIAADAQGRASGRPVAAICHSHPAIISESRDGDAGDARWGPATPSAVDLAQFRRGLPHVHQATIIASLPAEVGEPVPLTPYGYSARFGRIASDGGFWIVADHAAGAVERPTDDEHDMSEKCLCEGSVT